MGDAGLPQDVANVIYRQLAGSFSLQYRNGAGVTWALPKFMVALSAGRFETFMRKQIL
jgi:hypothetical protein